MTAPIPELDVDQLDANLYNAWQALQKRNYGRAENLVAASWKDVRLFRLSFDDDSHLPATTDRDVKALLTKALYWLRNLKRHSCYPEYNCEWVYPYGWVPEGGCPEHDE